MNADLIDKSSEQPVIIGVALNIFSPTFFFKWVLS
jgi:hypothetical protein